MKFDSGKAWPHPVLRPDSRDYPRAAFEVEIDLTWCRKSNRYDTAVDFNLSEPDLLDLVEGGEAEYVVVVRCPTTYYRRALSTREDTLKSSIEAGKVYGSTEFAPFLVSTVDLREFRAAGWHLDYDQLEPANLEAGSVLALDRPKEYWIDNAEDAPVSSIFEVEQGGTESGRWDCYLERDRIAIRLSGEDYRSFLAARERLGESEERAYIMNSVYLPALYHVLVAADADVQTYGEYRWFRSLNARLKDDHVSAKELGDPNQDRLRDAQKLLKYPFRRLPFMEAKDD